MLNDSPIVPIQECARWYWSDKPGWFFVGRCPGALIACVGVRKGGLALIRSTIEIKRLISEISTEHGSLEGVRLKIAGEKRFLETIREVAKEQGFKIEVEKEITKNISAFFSPTEGRLRLEREGTPVEPLPPQNVTPILHAISLQKTRILIVDDSKTIRQVLRMIFSRDSDIEVVGECENALGVEQAIETLKPNVISLDINMPEMDGVTLVKQMLPKRPIPVVMVTALSIEQGDQVLQALAAGAVDYIQKPKLAEVEAVADDICQRMKAAAKARVQVGLPSVQKSVIVAKNCNKKPIDKQMILIGSSTGGTEALREILQGLPAEIPPILIVQHIPPAFSAAFASRLSSLLPFTVGEAKDGDKVVPGRVLIAPGGFHMRLAKQGGDLVVRVADGTDITGHKPSVDALFRSAAPLVGSQAIAVILTGMGKDGAEGLLQLRNAGARTVGQDEATSVVYGMPGAAMRIGAVECELPLPRIASYLVELLEGQHQKTGLRKAQ